jgi:hypothetical protein
VGIHPLLAMGIVFIRFDRVFPKSPFQALQTLAAYASKVFHSFFLW